jgi:hypothetical protein
MMTQPTAAARRLQLEPFAVDGLVLAKPVGWNAQVKPPEPGSAFRAINFAPPSPEGGIAGLSVAAVPGVPFEEAPLPNPLSHAVPGSASDPFAVLDAYVKRTGVRVLVQGGCCLFSHSHYATALIDSGKDGPGRYGAVVVTANRFSFNSPTSVVSIVVLAADSAARFDAFDVKFLLLNIGQSIGPPRELPTQLVQGKWAAATGSGFNWITNSGTFVAYEQVGTYFEIEFQPGNQYRIISGNIGEGSGRETIAVFAWDYGQYQYDGGLVTFQQNRCVGRNYHNGVMTEEGACPRNWTPMAIRLQPLPAGRLEFAGVALSASLYDPALTNTGRRD